MNAAFKSKVLAWERPDVVSTGSKDNALNHAITLWPAESMA